MFKRKELTMKNIILKSGKSIQSKLLIAFLLASIIIYMAVIGIVAIRTNRMAKDNAQRITDNFASEYANLSAIELNVYMNAVRILSQQLEDFSKIEQHKRRAYFNNILVNLLERNDDFLSLWTIWEPHTIDTLDKLYEWSPGSTPIGNYSPTFYKINGKVRLEKNIADTSLQPLFSSEYYSLPKKRRNETILNPYNYSYTGDTKDDIYQTNMIAPIIKGDDFLGVIGVDVPLQTLQQMVDTIQPYEGGHAMLVTNDGILVTYPDETQVGKAIYEVYGASEQEYGITKKLKEGKSFSFKYYENGEKFYASFAPVEVGNTQTPWSIGVVVPYRIILGQAYTQLIIIILVALGGLIFITLVVVFIAKWISTPIKKATNILSDLSVGKIDNAGELIAHSNDELGAMAKALVRLANSTQRNSDFATHIGEGSFDQNYIPSGKDDLLGNALLKMQKNLKVYADSQEKTNWMQNSTVSIGEILRGEKTPEELTTELLSLFADILQIKVGAIYLINEDKKLGIIGSYAYDTRRSKSIQFELGEGLIGQAAKEKRTLIFTDVPDDYMVIQSGLGKTSPKHIVLLPLVNDDTLLGIVELGFSSELSSVQKEFLDKIQESISIGFNSMKVKQEMNDLLNKTMEQSEEMQLQQEQLQQQNEELQVQQDALKRSNEDLERKSRDLQKSEESLQSQQEELRVTNEELEEKTRSLEGERKKVTEQNMDLENAQADLERKAQELEASSKYKSEFLANMSHELRTPLNSLLILSKNLSENKEDNMNEEQLESLGIIYNSGHDLLNLINDILDLSKIESGKMALNFEKIRSSDISYSLNQSFKHMAEEKGLAFNVNIGEKYPQYMFTDFQRLGQILKNLVANAIKFTTDGSVDVDLYKPNGEVTYRNESLTQQEVIGIAVKDTGIGIPEEKRIAIFEAFQQADGSTSRQYGGTGLGLSISRELIRLLGGEIQLESEVGKGSNFTIFLPHLSTEGTQLPVTQESSHQEIKPVKNNIAQPEPIDVQKTELKPKATVVGDIKDDREVISDEDKVILIVEDDVYFARILQKQAKEKGFKTLVATRGSEGLSLGERFLPSAAILDINLPDIDGMKILDALKRNPETRHIPIHMMSAYEWTKDALEKGAIGYTTKPVSADQLTQAFNSIDGFVHKEMKELLIVEDDENLRKSIRVLIGENGIKITEAMNGKETLELIRNRHFDCMVLDLGLPDMTGFDLLHKIEADKTITTPPVIVYTGREITREENEELQKYAKSIIIKGVKSEERLLDESALFLHRVVKELPVEHQNIISNLHDKNRLFRNRKVLIIDDDMRNVFALSKVLKEKDIHVIKAENGKSGIERLVANPDTDLVLMDIMMPVMDGFDAIKHIRTLEKFKEIPIIALTAKAMKKDQDKCMNVGASDYLSKPLDVERLFSLMRVWLYNN